MTSVQNQPLRRILRIRLLAASLLLGVVLQACAAPSAAPPTTIPVSPSATVPASPSATPSPMTSPTPLPAAIGPAYRPGFNPLTGLPVLDVATLKQAPLLVSVTNFPVSARPQAGLSLASIVWEISIGEGMSRFLAVFYGDYLAEIERLLDERPLDSPYGYVIAPIRSGRVVYEDIKVLFPDATLITRGASAEVRPQLSNRIGVFAANAQDVNSAGLTLDDLRSLPVLQVMPQDHAGLLFTRQSPAGGTPATSLRMIYNRYDHVGWEYSAEQGSYLRSQDRADDSGILYPAIDRLTGKQLAFENVLVVFANHHFENVAGTILEIDLLNRSGQPGLLFRDGLQYPVRWTTEQGKLSIQSEAGEPLGLKPGQTFIEVVSFQSSWDDETKLLRFHAPFLPTETPGPTWTPSVTLTPMETATFEPTAVEEPSATPEPGGTPEPGATP
jgi:hypothetical protein